MSDVSFEKPIWPPPRCARPGCTFARLDTMTALEVIKSDNEIDAEFDGLMRKLITYMMEDPAPFPRRSTWCSLLRPLSAWATMPRTWPSKVIYIVKGLDVRHSSPGAVESIIK